MIFSVFQKNPILWYSWSTLLWDRCYYPHQSRDALSPQCGIFFNIHIFSGLVYCFIRHLKTHRSLPFCQLENINVFVSCGRFRFQVTGVWQDCQFYILDSKGRGKIKPIESVIRIILRRPPPFFLRTVIALGYFFSWHFFLINWVI